MLSGTATGCATVGSGDAVCGRLGPLLTAHASALADDGGPRSLSTGRALIATADAGCGG